jgi:hypothetical protein
VAKIFGKDGYELLVAHLVKMVTAQSEFKFESTLNAILMLHHTQVRKNGDLEFELTYLASRHC